MIDRILPVLGTITLAAVTAWAGLNAIHVIKTSGTRPPFTDANSYAGEKEESPIVDGAKVQPKIDLAPIVERPLFTPSRRAQPVSPPMSAKTKPQLAKELPVPPEIPPVKLHGVMTAAANPTALLSVAEEGPEWVSLGADVNGWRLKDIGADWVTLSNDDHVYKVEMY